MAWHDWKTITEAQRYIEEANIRLADSAAAKMIIGRDANKNGRASVYPQTRVRHFRRKPY
jgi:hypothetical protein